MKLSVVVHALEIALCRVVLFLLRVPRPPTQRLTREQRKLTELRVAALVPLVPVPEARSRLTRLRLHLSGLWRVLLDTAAVHRRKAAGNAEDFSPEVAAQLDAYPPYYRKTYHHQTDGYFTYASARRYDLQYELVFFGLGHLVRKVAASQLVRHLPQEGAYRMLECGSGTGDLGAAMQAIYPQAEVLISDPSLAYLRFAKEKYPHLRVRDASTFMEDLSFAESGTLDAVFSGFVFHEVPRVQARQALAEALRVLKPGGYLLILDACQRSDGPENAFAADQFGESFFEPYFDEFLAGSLLDECEQAGFEAVEREVVLFSKVIVGRKPAS